MYRNCKKEKAPTEAATSDADANSEIIQLKNSPSEGTCQEVTP